jgi:DNA-binding IclR family transcriptional regulator
VAIAVPVREPDGERQISALGVFGPEVRCPTKQEQRRWLNALLECANAIEASLR